MKTIYYYYNHYGSLILQYRDEYDNYTDECYMGYSRREAIQRFRKEHGLVRKHIRVEPLYG